MNRNTYTHADTCGGRGKSRHDTHVNTNPILIRNQSEQMGALPEPGGEQFPPHLSAQVPHSTGDPGLGASSRPEVSKDGEAHRRWVADTWT